MKINIMLGVSSAAAQIEGGGFVHTWSGWYEKGRIHDGSNPARANDHLNRWKEDIDLMAQMGITIYRLSVEWARLEPAKGRFDKEAVMWYRRLLEYMKSKGISPLLTLHHFTNPLWFEESGGFAEPANIPVFLDFVEFAVRQFGDLVNEYVTINEPNVFAVMGYHTGVFPPGKKSVIAAMKVQSVMACCHIQAYSLIHRLRKEMGYADTKAGFAHHARVFVPKNGRNIRHRICACVSSWMFQDALTSACLLGKFAFPLKNYSKAPRGQYADFLGLNYYTRSTVTSLADGVREGCARNDLGWEIYPEGIETSARGLYRLLERPVYITENGTCDNNDSFRCRYIYDHLKILENSVLPVERYYHWCFTDNFEWCEGESARFGLVHVDFDTQKRTIKKSGDFYRAIIKNKNVTEEMYNEYVNAQKYNVQ
ncbi:MAG: family 1 glycosylhydrolase [Treponema sp.]|jgi:beta-glucosidase|nr:family 1 glycosylhydrolase [Treponema sp.]